MLRNNSREDVSITKLYAILLGSAFVMLFITVGLSGLVASVDYSNRSETLIITCIQAILVFIIPSYLTAFYQTGNVRKELSINRFPDKKFFFYILGIYIVVTIPMNQLIFWNEHISLPESFREIELMMRSMEKAAQDATKEVMSDKSWFGLISGILIIGVLTGFAEEVFFRGGLQRISYNIMSRHASVWFSAFIFSFVHFQFYGFFPRLLLGALFGYFYLYSGSLWTSIFAHALNNSVAILIAWLSCRGYIDGEYVDSIGISSDGIPWIPFLCLPLFCILFKNYIDLAKVDNRSGN